LRTLRIKIKLEEPRRIDISYLAKGYDSNQFKIGNDLHEESTLSLSVSGAKIVDLNDLKESFVKNFNASPSWKVDDSPEGFMFQADAAMVSVGLGADIWVPALVKSTRAAYNKDWDSLFQRQVVKAKDLHMKIKQAAPPPK
jgi:hypothetical protein